MKNRLWLILLVFFWTPSFGQEYSTLVVGKWTLKEKVPENTDSSILFGSKEPLETITLSFYKNDKGYDHDSKVKFEYTLSGVDLTIGNRGYQIKQLTKDKMVLEEKESMVSLSQSILIFVRDDD